MVPSHPLLRDAVAEALGSARVLEFLLRDEARRYCYTLSPEVLADPARRETAIRRIREIAGVARSLATPARR